VVHTRNLAIAAGSAAVALLAAAAVVSFRGGDNAASAKLSTGPSTLPSNAGSASQFGPRRLPSEPSSHSNDADPFVVVIRTKEGDLTANVVPISVRSNELVDPPHSTAQEWNTAVWVRQSAYPSASSEGTSYVYGHACHYHICPFTNLNETQVGEEVVVTTPWRIVTYRIDRIGLSPKSAVSLPPWASDSTVANQLVLVTCAFEHGDTSTSNLVVDAHLISAHAR
jgi:hypothetical protein